MANNTTKQQQLERMADNLLDEIEQVRNKLDTIRMQWNESSRVDNDLHEADSYLKEAQLVLEDMIMANYYKNY